MARLDRPCAEIIPAIIAEHSPRVLDEEIPAERMRIRQERLRQMVQRSLFGANAK